VILQLSSGIPIKSDNALIIREDVPIVALNTTDNGVSSLKGIYPYLLH